MTTSSPLFENSRERNHWFNAKTWKPETPRKIRGRSTWPSISRSQNGIIRAHALLIAKRENTVVRGTFSTNVWKKEETEDKIAGEKYLANEGWKPWRGDKNRWNEKKTEREKKGRSRIKSSGPEIAGGKQREPLVPILRFLGWRKEKKREKEKERKEQPSLYLIARVEKKKKEKKIQRWKRRSRCEFHSISRLLTIERARSSLYIRRLYPGNVFSTRSCGIAERASENEREKERERERERKRKSSVPFPSLSISGTGLIARRIVVKDFRLRFVAVFHSPLSLFFFFSRDV